MISSYAQAVAALYGRINYERLGTEQYTAGDLKLERMAALLDLLGNPQRSIPVVHVAGTKGKGTTCSLVTAFLQQSGYRVGLYTSPHRERVEERLTVNQQLPEEATFTALVAELMDLLAAQPADHPTRSATFFECVNAIAWRHFQQQQVDLAVLEVGLGGRLDSTNLCAPLVTAITSISYDHTRILGNTLPLIAAEKAGIIKPGIPVVCGVEEPSARETIWRRAAELGAPLRQIDRDFRAEILAPWTATERVQTVRIETGLKLPEQPVSERQLSADLPAHSSAQMSAQTESRRARQFEVQLRYPGPVYARNAAIALACVQEIEQAFPCPTVAIEQAAANVELPLRFEILAEQPCLIADAAHNPASLRALLQTVQSVFPGRPVTVLLAVSRDKDYLACCREMAGVSRVIATCYRGNERSLSSEQLRETLAEVYVGELHHTEDPEIAWQLGQQLARPGEVILATGSLFFAAEMRQLLRHATPVSKTGQVTSGLPLETEPVLSSRSHL